jgi:glycosyltransferase involved in cell wall biosynthesis
MAFGLPVIFSNHGPSAEIIKKENCGICVDPMNISEIVQAMKSLLGNKPLYEMYSQNALTAVQEKYTWEKEKHKLTAIYQNLLKNEKETL